MPALVLSIALSSAGAATFSEHDLGEYYLPERSDEEVVREASWSVARIGGATGFVVHPDGWLLTNAHVAAAVGDTTWVRLADREDRLGDAVHATLAHVDTTWDVALYRLEVDEPLPAIRIRRSSTVVGEPVAVLGHPAQKPQRVSFGTVLTKGLVIAGRPSVEYSAQTWWGSSGSVVLDADGEAIAVHWGWDADGQSKGRLTGVPLGLLLWVWEPLASLVDDP